MEEEKPEARTAWDYTQLDKLWDFIAPGKTKYQRGFVGPMNEGEVNRFRGKKRRYRRKRKTSYAVSKLRRDAYQWRRLRDRVFMKQYGVGGRLRGVGAKPYRRRYRRYRRR